MQKQSLQIYQKGCAPGDKVFLKHTMHLVIPLLGIYHPSFVYANFDVGSRNKAMDLEISFNTIFRFWGIHLCDSYYFI